MTQQSKKTAGQGSKSSSAKTSRPAAEAAEKFRSASENVLGFSTSAMRDFLSGSADPKRALQMGRESAEQLAQAADTFTKLAYESANLSRGNVEAAIECANVSAAMARDMVSEVIESTNRAFSEQVELSKAFFACRTINDMFDLQNRMLRSAIDNFFNQSVRLSGMVFEYTGEAMEPINERFAEASEQFSKALAA